MIGLRRSDGNQRIGALRQSISNKELQLAGLVSPRRQPEQVIALDEQLRPPECGGQARHRLDRREAMSVTAARKSGEIHSPVVTVVAVLGNLSLQSVIISAAGGDPTGFLRSKTSGIIATVTQNSM